MKKITKVSILVVVLAVPAFVFIFLYSTAKNYYDLPVYFAKDSTLVDGRYVITDAHKIPSFSFTNQDGKAYASSNLKGKIYVADFFFTTCTTICPKMTTQLTRVQEAFKKDSIFKIVSFTVDPEHDSAEVLKEYATDFKADSSKWNFMTGSKDAIYKLAQRGFFISAMEDKTDTSIPSFIHSERIVLVDQKGRIRGYYNGTDKVDVDRLIREVQVLLSQL